jgi:DNA adenine methylase
MKSLIKWVGSKKWIAPRISKLVRTHLTGTYYEPFAGGAAVFFDLEPHDAVLCDTIYPLIATYQFLQTDYIQIKDHLCAISQGTNNKMIYMAARNRFNELMSHGISNPETAALFLYLNKAGFNGLWRQNSDGEFNVPFGQHSNLNIPTFADLIATSKVLQKAKLIHIAEPINVLDIINRAKAGDVVFADPPYYKTYDNYDGLKLPSNEFQQRIALALWQANLRGAVIIAMNNDTPETQRWYNAFCDIKIIERIQNIAANTKDRKQWNQILAVAL